MSVSVPLSYVGHLVTIPAEVNDSTRARFIFDTGVGLNVIFRSFSDEIGFEKTGATYRGKRMSGHELSCELVSVPSLSVPGLSRRDVTAGVVDMKLPEGLSDVKGILSLGFFKDTRFTLDYFSNNLILEDDGTFSDRLTRGAQVPIVLREEGPSLDAFLDLKLPNGRTIPVEVDTGSDDLILNEPFMGELGVRKKDSERIEGTDETGNGFTRYVTNELPGSIRLAAAEDFAQEAPNVIFQNIIYDGLLGFSFLKRYVVSYDVVGSRMIFGMT